MIQRQPAMARIRVSGYSGTRKVWPVLADFMFRAPNLGCTVKARSETQSCS